MFQSDEEEGSSGDDKDMWNSSQDSEFESYLGRIEDYTKRRVPNVLSSNLIAVSSGGVKDFKVPNCLNPEELQCSFEKGWNELLPEAERAKLQKLHGIEEDSLKVIDASEVIKGNIGALPQSQQVIIQSLIKQGFFSKIYQKKLAIEKMLSLYDQKDELEKQLREVQLQLQLQQQGSEQSEADTPVTNASQNEQNEEGDKLLNALMFESEISSSLSHSARQSSQELIESQLANFNEFRGSQDSDRTLSYISDMETDNPKSEYNKQRRRDIKELSKQFARDAIKRHNKKQLQAFTFTTESRLPGRTRISISDVIDEDFDLAWIQSSERFKSCARARQTLTIAAFNPKDPFVIEYRRQESERYRNPLDPWLYYLPDGRTAIVGPVYRKKAQIQNKPREHLFLKSERPASANILAIVRDAASRLPDFIGTRSDVSELCKASQFLSDNLTDFYISQTVSGGLDRLSAEEDPCVRYDQTNKLWIYLHGKRKLDSHKWLSGLNCQETARKQAGERGGFSSNEIYGIGKSTPSSSGTSSAMKRQGINSTNDTTDPNRISDNE